MADYGLEVSRIGYDVDSASDKQLAFSSEWPLLPIEAEGTTTINVPSGGAGNVTQTIYTHDLGYEPVFYLHRVSGGSFWLSWGWVDDEKFWINAYISSNVTIKWKIFRRPIKTNFEATELGAEDVTQEIDKDYGLLVSLPGKDVSSTDKRDFSIRSDLRQLMVHKSGYTTTATSGVEVDHNLGYKPLFFVYLESTAGSGEYRFASKADDVSILASTTQISFGGRILPFPNWAYIIFKDTLNADG